MVMLPNQVCFGSVSLNGLTSRLSDMLGLSSLSLSKPDLQDIQKCTEKGQRSDIRVFLLASFVTNHQSLAEILAGKASTTSGLGQPNMHLPCCQIHSQDTSRAQTTLYQDGKWITCASRFVIIGTNTHPGVALLSKAAESLPPQHMLDRWAKGELLMTKSSAQYSSGSTWIWGGPLCMLTAQQRATWCAFFPTSSYRG